MLEVSTYFLAIDLNGGSWISGPDELFRNVDTHGETPRVSPNEIAFIINTFDEHYALFFYFVLRERMKE